MLLLKSRIIYILYNIALLSISFLFNRFYQMLMFVLFFEWVQSCFNKRFHAETICKDPIKAVRYCKLITVLVEIIYLIICSDLNILLYSNLFLIVSTAFISALVQYYFENTIVSISLFKDKDYLVNLCKSKGLSNDATNRMILRYIDNKKVSEIAQIEHVEVATIKQSLRRSRKIILGDN